MPRRKLPGSRADERPSRQAPVLELVPAAEIPPPPANLLEGSVATWDAFWRSDVSGLVQGSDQRRLRQWIEAVDQIERLRAVVKEEGMTTEGSMGQARLHPLLSEIRHLEGMVEKAESEFYMTPAARMRAGIRVAGGATATGGGSSRVDELNARIKAALAAGSDDELGAGFSA